MTRTDAEWIAARRAEQRAKDAADRAAYERECIASWEGRDQSNTRITPAFPPALGGAV